MTPSKATCSWKDWATLTASWPVIASSTSSTFVGFDGVAHARELVHQRLVDVQPAGGVEDDDVVAGGLRRLDPVLARPRPDPSCPCGRPGSGSGGRAARAGRSRRGAAGRRRRARASSPPCAAAARASRTSSSCRSPAGRRAGSPSAGARTRAASRRSPSARSAPRARSSRPAGPALRLFSTSCPVARSRTWATKSLTTWKLTSASSSASRISRIAFEIASSSRRPLPRRSPRACWSLSESVSNTGNQCRPHAQRFFSHRPFRTRRVLAPTCPFTARRVLAPTCALRTRLRWPATSAWAKSCGSSARRRGAAGGEGLPARDRLRRGSARPS